MPARGLTDRLLAFTVDDRPHIASSLREAAVSVNNRASRGFSFSPHVKLAHRVSGQPGYPGAGRPGGAPRRKSRPWRAPALIATIGATALVVAYAGTAQAGLAAAPAPGTATAARSGPPACPDGSGRAPLYRDTGYSFAERAA